MCGRNALFYFSHGLKPEDLKIILNELSEISQGITIKLLSENRFN